MTKPLANKKPLLFSRQEDINQAIRDYTVSQLSLRLVALKHDVSCSTIRKLFRKHGVKSRPMHERNEFDDDFFETIDTEAKAYFLGLMMADGSVFKTPERNWRFSINLQEPDRYILETFREAIRYEGHLSKINYSQVKRKDDFDCQDAYALQGVSNKFCADLIRHGCVPHKTKYLEWLKPGTMPDDLMHHFVRGFFDGDGWNNVEAPHGYHKSPNNCIGFVGTKTFLTGLKDYLNNRLGIGDRKVQDKKHNFAKAISIAGNLKTKKVYDFMYEGATIYLTRKRDKFVFSETPLKMGARPKACRQVISSTSLDSGQSCDAHLHLAGSQPIAILDAPESQDIAS